MTNQPASYTLHGMSPLAAYLIASRRTVDALRRMNDDAPAIRRHIETHQFKAEQDLSRLATRIIDGSF